MEMSIWTISHSAIGRHSLWLLIVTDSARKQDFDQSV